MRSPGVAFGVSRRDADADDFGPWRGSRRRPSSRTAIAARCRFGRRTARGSRRAWCWQRPSSSNGAAPGALLLPSSGGWPSWGRPLLHSAIGRAASAGSLEAALIYSNTSLFSGNILLWVMNGPCERDSAATGKHACFPALGDLWSARMGCSCRSRRLLIFGFRPDPGEMGIAGRRRSRLVAVLISAAPSCYGSGTSLSGRNIAPFCGSAPPALGRWRAEILRPSARSRP